MIDYYLLCLNRFIVGNFFKLSRGWLGVRKELDYYLGIEKGLKVVYGSIYYIYVDMFKI